MSNESNFPQHEGDQPQHPKLQLTMEEVRVLRECNRESFWYRSLPLAATFITATQVAVSRGILVGHPKYGSLFKSLAAGVCGYFIGKVSYQGKCRDKLLQLENSPLADSLRTARDKARSGERGFSVPNADRSSGSLANRSYQESGFENSGGVTSFNKNNNMDLDISSNKTNDIDDNYRQNLENENYPKLEDPQTVNPLKETDYDTLRRKNREEYEKSYRTSTSTTVPQRPQFSPPPSRQPYNQPNQSPKPKNKYGDVWDE